MSPRTKKKAKVKAPRLERIELAALNVAAQPHPPDVYKNLLIAADSKNAHAHYFGNKSALLGDLVTVELPTEVSSDGKTETLLREYVLGNIKLFTDFDMRRWVNTLSKQEASDTEQATLSSTISTWRPEHDNIPFLFDLANHIVVVDITKFNINHACRIFSRILGQTKVREAISPKIMYVEVTVIPDQKTVEQILSYPILTYLKIALTRMNGDELGGTKETFDASLRRHRAKRGVIELWAEPASSLEIDDYLASSAKTASVNGLVEGKGLDNQGNRLKNSTQNTPLVLSARINPKERTRDSFMFEALAKFVLGVP